VRSCGLVVRASNPGAEKKRGVAPFGSIFLGSQVPRATFARLAGVGLADCAYRTSEDGSGTDTISQLLDSESCPAF
jgi:hypothetical protein